MASVESTSDARVVNNAVRHNYRILNDAEKELMVLIKDKGLEFLNVLDAMKPSREVSLAKTKVEEAVMWAIKGLTS